MARLNLWAATGQFVLSVLFIANFSYFMIQHSRKANQPINMAQCMVRAGINHPIHVTADTNMDFVIDGGEIFYYLFMMGLSLNFILAGQALFSCFAARQCATCVRATIIMLNVVLVLFQCVVTYTRYSHVGKVCSGDYLIKPYTLETRDLNVLEMEGEFLEVYVFASWIWNVIIVLTLMNHKVGDEISNDKNERDD